MVGDGSLLWLISQPPMRAAGGVVAGRRARATAGSDSDLLALVPVTTGMIIRVVDIIVVDASSAQ